jgi:cytochrome oxidase Cu insertion factor (SCO1/SenC/PrrC family)
MNFIRLLTALIGMMVIASGCAAPAAVQLSPISASVEPAPAWLTVPVVDAKTGKAFMVSDLKGKVVLVEGMATWCPSCWAQGREIKKLYGLLGPNTDLITISLDMDTREDAQSLVDYSKIDHYDWQFVTSSLPMYRDLGNRYGALYLDPTLGPFLVVDRKGNVSHFESGLKTAADLKTILEPLLKGG